MHKMLVLYGQPDDPEAFRSRYESVHVPLVRQVPGVTALKYSLQARGIGADAPYFAVAELWFDDAASMRTGLKSPEGQAMAADFQQSAPPGTVLLQYTLED